VFCDEPFVQFEDDLRDALPRAGVLVLEVEAGH
jgi:hypothetical protein